MNISKFSSAVSIAFVLAAPVASAAVLGVYDLGGASGTTLPISSSGPGFTFSSMNAVGVTGAAFSNHFYFAGWGAVQDAGKYLGLTMSSAQAYDLTSMTFSVESTSPAAATVQVRSSVDAFSSIIDSFSWGPSAGTPVTDGTLDLSSIGQVSGALDLRFYFIGDTASHGFANHACPGAGCGLADVGRQITINGNVVSLPGTLALAGLGLGLIGLRGRRARK